MVAASLTNEQAADYAAAVQALEPHGIALPVAAAGLAECLSVVGDVSTMISAVKDFARRHPSNLPKVQLAEAVERFLEAKGTSCNCRP